MEIVKYDGNYIDEIKSLFVQLQEYLIGIDDENVLIMNENYKDNYFEYVVKTIEENNGIMYLAIEGTKVLGLITGIVEPPDDEDKIVNICPLRGYVSELVVDKNDRKQGVGKQLIKKIEEWFAKQECDFIRINVLAQNKEALKFYEKNEYKPIDIELSKKIQK